MKGNTGTRLGLGYAMSYLNIYDVNYHMNLIPAILKILPLPLKKRSNELSY